MRALVACLLQELLCSIVPGTPRLDAEHVLVPPFRLQPVMQLFSLAFVGRARALLIRLELTFGLVGRRCRSNAKLTTTGCRYGE